MYLVMRHQVTSEQYQRLLNARENWPTYLKGGARGYDVYGCLLDHLAENAGIGVMAADPSKNPIRGNISLMYGIPQQILSKFVRENDASFYCILGKRARAIGMFYSFDRFIDEVKVKSESNEIDLEYFNAEFSNENPMVLEELAC